MNRKVSTEAPLGIGCVLELFLIFPCCVIPQFIVELAKPIQPASDVVWPFAVCSPIIVPRLPKAVPISTSEGSEVMASAKPLELNKQMPTRRCADHFWLTNIKVD